MKPSPAAEPTGIDAWIWSQVYMRIIGRWKPELNAWMCAVDRNDDRADAELMHDLEFCRASERWARTPQYLRAYAHSLMKCSEWAPGSVPQQFNITYCA